MLGVILTAVVISWLPNVVSETGGKSQNELLSTNVHRNPLFHTLGLPWLYIGCTQSLTIRLLLLSLSVICRFFSPPSCKFIAERQGSDIAHAVWE